MSALGLCTPVPSWHPCPLGVRSPGAAGAWGGQKRLVVAFWSPSGRGRNRGGILISCQSKQKRGEVTSYLLLPPAPAPLPRRLPQRGGRARPRAPVLLVHIIAGTGAPEQYRGAKHPGGGSDGKSPSPSCSSLTPGPSVRVHSPGTAFAPAVPQREPSPGPSPSGSPLDKAFAAVGNGFSEGFVCQRRKLGWNLQEESLKGTAKNYISFPERASSCAGAQRRVPKQREPEAYAKVISGEGSLLREKFSNSHNQLPAYVYS